MFRPQEELVACFNMPSEEAARHLGIGLTVLKRICRQYGVPRWPFRKIKSLDRLLQNVEVRLHFYIASRTTLRHPAFYSPGSKALSSALFCMAVFGN